MSPPDARDLKKPTPRLVLLKCARPAAPPSRAHAAALQLPRPLATRRALAQINTETELNLKLLALVITTLMFKCRIVVRGMPRRRVRAAPRRRIASRRPPRAPLADQGALGEEAENGATPTLAEDEAGPGAE